MNNQFVLYGRRGAGSVAPQCVLEELGIPYQMEWVERNLAPDQAAAYRQICPTGKIPALTLPDGSTLFESAAICIHLAELPGNVRLAPARGSDQYAQFLQWMLFMATSLYGSAVRLYGAQRYTTGSTEQEVEGVRQAALQEFESALAVLEAQVTGTTVCENFSVADIYLAMLVSWHPEGDAVVRAKYPKLAAICDQVNARPLIRTVMQLNEE